MARGRYGTAGTIAGAIALVLAGHGAAEASPDARVDRQIAVFERVLDDVLVESPNWLVRSRHETRGRYRKGEGARFRFDASLVGAGSWGGARWWSGWWDGDERVIVIRGDDDDEKVAKKEKKAKKEARADRRLEKEERRYTRGKAELIEAMLDFGELLTAVPDGESLVIEVDLENADWFDEKNLTTLKLEAKMADLRAWSGGRIDEKTMVGRIKVSES